MNKKPLFGLLAGLSGPLLFTTALNAAEREGYYVQSETELGQSGAQGQGDGAADKNTSDQQTTPSAVSPGGGTTTTEPGQGGAKEGGASDQNATDQQPAPGAASPGGGAMTMGQPPGGSENHAQEALKHARAAVGSGKRGDFSNIAKHAQLSKTHVEAALKDKPDDPHLQAALKSLDEAIVEGHRGNGDRARKSAKEAVTHLKAIK